MTRFGWLVAFGWVAALWAFDTRGDETTVALSGELHVRSELTDGDFSADTEPSRATLLRSRMNVKASPSEDVAVAFTLQDAREYGSEPSTTANLRNLDLYAGHLTISRFLSDNLTLQLGRMPLSYGDERLVGVSVWSNMGRAFDGTRAQYRVSDAASIDLWGTKVRAESDERTREDRGYYFGGTYGSYKTDELKLNVYALSERDNGDANMSRWTLGTEDDLNFGAFMVRTEAAMQFGDRGGKTIRGHFFALAGSYRIPAEWKPTVTVGYDHLSGNDGDTTAFDTVFGTNHKLYGLFDLLPERNAVGLRDVRVALSLQPAKPLTLTAEAHHLMSAVEDGDESTYGQELNAQASYSYRTGLAFRAGGAIFFADELTHARFGGENSSAMWLYLMTTATF